MRRMYPNILFAEDGEIFDFDGYSMYCALVERIVQINIIALQEGRRGLRDEQPSAAIKAYVEKQLNACGNNINIVLSHTCPLKYEPTEVFLRGFNQNEVDKSTEAWLDEIEAKIYYDQWYCGHYHTSKKIDKLQFMFDDISVLKLN